MRPAESIRRLAARLVALALLGTGGPLAAAELKLRLLETTDLHMFLLNHDYYLDKPTDEFGLAKTITLIKAARAEVKNSLLFDNGDLIQGSPLGDQVATVQALAAGQVHPVYKVLNALGVDAANIGNHEFNYGLPYLRQALAGASFPYVNANVMVAEPGVADAQLKHAFTPTVMLQRRFTDEAGTVHLLKIGVIGFVPPQIMVWDRSHLQGKLRVMDIIQTAERLVPQLRAQGADVVVAIPHSGLEFGTTVLFDENVVARLARVPGIDAILFGHSHGEFPGGFFSRHPQVDLARGTINGVPAVMPGAWGSHLGVVDLVLSNASGAWQVQDGRSHLRAIYDRATRQPLVAADPMVAALVGTAHAATVATLAAGVASTRAAITTYFSLVTADSSVQLIAQGQRARARQLLQGTAFEALPLLSAASPFKAGGRMGPRYYTDIPAGPIALRQVASLYVYPNTLKAVKLTGAQVRQWLEMSAGQFRRIDPQGPAEQALIDDAFVSYNFDVIEGVSYAIDVTQAARYDPKGKLLAPTAQRIVDLRYQGRAIDEAALFVVVTNNYRANGGGGFPGLDGSNLVLDTQDENRGAVAAYIAAQKNLNPVADQNWRILPVPGIKLRFTAGEDGIAHLARYPQVRLVQRLAEGWAQYELAP